MADKTIIWDDSFLNDNPHGDTGLVRDTGYYINETRQALTERLDDEHEFDPDEPAPQPEQGRHKPGSAVAYAQDDPPQFRPDGITPIDADDKGRLWFDTLNGQIKSWDGVSAWVNLSEQGSGTILRWQASTQYFQYEIAEYQGRLWQAVADPPVMGIQPDNPEWHLFGTTMPTNIEWQTKVNYSANQCVYHNGVFWKAVTPVLGFGPGDVPGQWTELQMGTNSIADNSVTNAKMADNAIGTVEIIANAVTTAKILDSNVTAAKLATNSVQTAKIVDLNVTTAKIADKAATFAKAGPDLYKVHIWDATIPYLIDDIVRYGKQWWIALTNPPIGTIPSLAGTDWRRWTPQTVVSVSNTATVTNGYPDHVVFCDTTINPVYTLTLTDGTKVGDKITVACYGGGEVTVVGTGLSEQKQLDNSIQYMWSAVGWLPLGGGSAGGGSGVSVGEVTWWPGQSGVGIPEGKLVADGTIYNIADYPTLFGKLGTLYGGDGATTFGVPNLQGIFPGAQGTQGTHGGVESIGTIREDSIESHVHTTAGGEGGHTHTLQSSDSQANPVYTNKGAAGPAVYAGKFLTINDNGVHGHTILAQAGAGAETRPAALVGRWLIQAEPPVPTEINAVVVDVEIGDVRWQGHSNQSTHDMICDGRSLITTNYPDLFAKIGYNFGGSGTNFNIPNLQGITPGAFGTRDVNGRTKGDATAIGGIREDADQHVTGDFQARRFRPDSEALHSFTGAFVGGGFVGATHPEFDNSSDVSQNQLIQFNNGLVVRVAPYSRSNELVGHWVIRVTQPAPFVLGDLNDMFRYDFVDTPTVDITYVMPTGVKENTRLVVKNIGTGAVWRKIRGLPDCDFIQQGVAAEFIYKSGAWHCIKCPQQSLVIHNDSTTTGAKTLPNGQKFSDWDWIASHGGRSNPYNAGGGFLSMARFIAGIGLGSNSSTSTANRFAYAQYTNDTTFQGYVEDSSKLWELSVHKDGI